MQQFIFNNLTDVKSFQHQLSRYSNEINGTDLPYIDLPKAFSKLDLNSEQDRAIFGALVDLKLNFVILTIDNINSGPLKYLKKESNESDDAGNVLTDYTFFTNRMEIHRHNSNYITRYRAIWDKLMGLFVLCHSEEDYKTFNNTKSRKKAFKKLSKNITWLKQSYVEELLEHLQEFDETFRTSEVHRFGALKKYSFLPNPYSTDQYIFLRGTWNVLLQSLVFLNHLIDNIE